MKVLFNRLVTHQLQYLKNADYILILEKGEVDKQGKYEDMKEEGLDIDSLEKHFLLSDEKYLQINQGKMTVTTEQENLNRRERRESECSKPQGLITLAEDRSVGTISARLYWRYFRSGLPAILLIMLALLFLFSQGKVYKR